MSDSKKGKDKRYSLTIYVRDLLHELANVYFDELKGSESEVVSSIDRSLDKGRRSKTLEKDHFRLVGALHQPRKRSLILNSNAAEKKRKIHHFEVNNYERKHCIICKQNTTYFCEVCNIWLHLNEEGRECWKEYHTKKNLCVD